MNRTSWINYRLARSVAVCVVYAYYLYNDRNLLIIITNSELTAAADAELEGDVIVVKCAKMLLLWIPRLLF